jgi:hypothetical protein
MIDSAALTIFGRDGTKDRMFDRPNSAAMNKPRPLFTGDTENSSAGSSSDFSDAPELVSDDALPSIVTLIIPTYELEEAQ